jgi:hypothetical protein
MVCSIDTGIISHCSENVTHVLGLEPTDLLGHDVRDILPSTVVNLMIQGAVHARVHMDEMAAAASHRATQEDESEESKRQEIAPPCDEAEWWIVAFKLGDVPMKEIEGVHFMVPCELNGRQMSVVAHRPNQSDRLVAVHATVSDNARWSG